MIEEVLPSLYCIEVPLPNNPLRALNSYIFKGDGRNLIVDTGMNRPECEKVITAGLKELGIDLDKTDLFITHVHADHSGLCKTLSRPSSKIFMSKKDAILRNNMSPARSKSIHDIFFANGFPEPELSDALDRHPGRRFGVKGPVDFTWVQDGDPISIGDYSFTCIETPGHSPGHMCLYDARKKLLLSGDHILIDITPNIMLWLELKNSLHNYMESLKKVDKLDVALVLPGHRRRITDLHARIGDLFKHHQDRADEAMIALRESDKNAWQVAPRITWDIDCTSWETFPPQQKYFAFGETLAHLEYLEMLGKVKRTGHNGQTAYSIA